MSFWFEINSNDEKCEDFVLSIVDTHFSTVKVEVELALSLSRL
jgi:hypothetical protein